jgi:HPt (histidine-containing phosphotransfer) domain-containing protein
MRQAVAGFVSRLPARVDSLLSLSAEGNLEELGRCIHQLKGSGTGYGFPALSQTAARAEAAIKSHAALDDIKRGVDELVTLIRSTQGYNAQAEANHAAPENSAR